MLLAGDIGGTTIRLGFFDRTAPRPRPVAVRTFPTRGERDLAAMLAALAADASVGAGEIDGACLGIAGPVTAERAEVTNARPPWTIDARAIEAAAGIGRVRLVNDMEALAYAIPLLLAHESAVLQEGRARPGGNIALIAAGTGLGECILHAIDGRLVPLASEGGHADFAARTEREIDVLRDLVGRFGHAPVEHVVSGQGLVNLHRATHRGPCLALEDPDAADAPALITRAALDRRCPGCVEALGVFVDAFGAEAGNLALRATATGGVFLGGGIAPKILPALADGRFVRAFTDKAPPFGGMLAAVPVKVILNEEAGLLGAARCALIREFDADSRI